MLFFSHWLDLIGKLISLAIFVALLLQFNIIEMVESAMGRTPNPEFFTILALGVILVGYYFVFHRPIVDVVMTQLYVRQRFGVQVSWDQAKLLRRLFCLSFRTMQWHPMRHVCSLPLDQRLPALVEAAAHD